MTFELNITETPAENIHRLLTEEINFVHEQMSVTGDAQHEALFQSRKRFKRIRAILRLIRSEIGEAAYQHENSFYREASRLIAPLRDSAVIVNAFNTLVESGENAGAQTSAIEAWITMQYEIMSELLLEEVDITDKLAQLMEHGRNRIPTLTISNQTFAAYANGIETIYAQNQSLRQNAYQDSHYAENFHEWRKQIKYLWHTIEILQPLQPEIYTPLAEDLHLLADALGDAHDLFIFRQLLQTDGSHLITDPDGEHFLQAIHQRQETLEQSIRPLSQTIFAPTPTQFTQQIATAYHQWQPPNP